MNFLFLCNLRLPCIQEKHRNIQIYVHIGVDVVNLPLIINNALLVTDPTKQNLCFSLKIYTALIKTLALHLKKKKENYTKNYTNCTNCQTHWQPKPITYAPPNIR